MTVEREIRELEKDVAEVIGKFWDAYYSLDVKDILELKDAVEKLIWDLQAVYDNLVAIRYDPEAPQFKLKIPKPPRIPPQRMFED